MAVLYSWNRTFYEISLDAADGSSPTFTATMNVPYNSGLARVIARVGLSGQEYARDTASPREASSGLARVYCTVTDPAHGESDVFTTTQSMAINTVRHGDLPAAVYSVSSLWMPTVVMDERVKRAAPGSPGPGIVILWSVQYIPVPGLLTDTYVYPFLQGELDISVLTYT